jgi:hypothetical protein
MRTTPRRTQLYTLRDFTGGLNLVADTFRLAENESPDLLNVDIDRRGGFQVRRGVEPFSNTALSGAPNAIWSYNDSGTVHTMVQVGAIVYSNLPSVWTAVGSNLGSASQDVSPVTFNNINYWTRGDAAVVKWDGATASTVGDAFNNTTVATSNNIPRADHMAVHSGYMWVAGTWEGGTHYPNRVRWSWANTFDNSGENWDIDDYIDIDDGKDSDAITAIVPFADQLVVFKRDSIYAIYGYSGESFSVVNVSNTIGATSRHAAIATPAGLFFFDHQTGLNVYTGSNTSWTFEQIWPAMRDGSIPSDSIDNVDLGWIENRLWVSVPWYDLPGIPRGMTFVFDPLVKQGGSWTKYSLKAGPYAYGHRTQDYFAYLHGTNKIYRLDKQDQYYDNMGTGSASVPIDAYYRTRWVDINEPAVKKRWRRTEAVLQVDQAYNLPVVSYSDYDSSVTVKNFNFTGEQLGTSSGVDVWDGPTAEWDESLWARSGNYGYVDRGSMLGIARSVSLKVGGQVLSVANPTVPQAPVFWGVDALIFKFVPRRVR